MPLVVLCVVLGLVVVCVLIEVLDLIKAEVVEGVVVVVVVVVGFRLQSFGSLETTELLAAVSGSGLRFLRAE